jgi:hypothetical protein
MNFRDQATTELTALVERLAAAADAAARAAAAEAQAAAQPTIDGLQKERAALDRALQEEKRAKQALEQARTGLEKTRAGLEKARAALEKERDALKTSLEAARADAGETKRNLEAKLDASRAEAVATKRDLETKLEAVRTQAAGTKQEFQAQLNAARAELAGTKHDLQAQVDAVHAQLDAARSEVETARMDAARTRADLESKIGDAEREAAEATARAKAWRLEQGHAMRDQAITFVARSLDRLLAVSESFAGVSTADDVLAAMVGALSTEFTRVALFNVAGNQLENVQHVGFAFPADSSHLVIPHQIDAALTRAITSGQIEILSADALAQADGTAFGGTPKCALALPLDMDGEPFAVIYADDSDQPNQAFANVELRRKFAALLRQQAVPLLMRLPTEMKAAAEFREYAARLVAELENMYAADVAARKKGDDLRRRLKDNVECARGIYSQRVMAEAPSAVGLIEDELALVVASKRATAYGRDLSAVLGGGSEEPARRPQGARALVQP